MMVMKEEVERVLEKTDDVVRTDEVDGGHVVGTDEVN